jgi:hypothetical protein
VPMARVTIYGNVADSLGVGPYQGDTGDALQTLGVADVVYRDNWTRNPIGRSCLYSAGVSARLVLTGSVCGGRYGLRGEGGLAYTVPGSLITDNAVLPFTTTFDAWPQAPADSTRDALLRGVTP